MRKIQIAISFVPLLLATADSLSAIREALTAKYGLTTTTADKTDVVSIGSVLILAKSNLLTADATSMVALSNTYKGGNITQGLMGHLANGAAGTRTFVAGEKLWVTGIDVRSKGVVFTLFSDSYSGLHYRTTLTFSFAKGAIPSATEAIAMVGEVFATEATGNEVAGERPAAVSTQAPDNTVWDSKYGRMTSDDLQRMDNATARLDLNYFRLNPAALDQRPVMQYFIALNNCNNHDVERALFNEIDYPALAAFYKLKAPQILASLPRTVTDLALDRGQGGWVLWGRYANGQIAKSLSLGEYDPRRKAFPLKYPGKDGAEISDSLSTPSSGRGKSCPAAAKAAAGAASYLPATYAISLKPAVYRELPMDEDAARKYIDRAGPQRNAFLVVDVTLLDSPPNISRANNTISEASFRAQTARIRVIDANTQKPLGTLFDDHSLPSEAQVAQAPSPPPAKPAESFAFGDHMYDIRTAVYVVLASDACGWPLTAEQSANVRGFVDRMSKGYFNEKYQYNLAHSRIKDAITARGRANFCANPVERRDFDKFAATVAPLGPLAAPATK